MCIAESQKRAAKGSSFKEEERATLYLSSEAALLVWSPASRDDWRLADGASWFVTCRWCSSCSSYFHIFSKKCPFVKTKRDYKKLAWSTSGSDWLTLSARLSWLVDWAISWWPEPACCCLAPKEPVLRTGRPDLMSRGMVSLLQMKSLVNCLMYKLKLCKAPSVKARVHCHKSVRPVPEKRRAKSPAVQDQLR